MKTLIKLSALALLMTGCATVETTIPVICSFSYVDNTYVKASCEGRPMGCTALPDHIGMACWNDIATCKTDATGEFVCQRIQGIGG